MIILRTEDDGSVRAAAILLTQGELARAVRDQAGDFLAVARGTLIETTRGVLTVEAMVRQVRARRDAAAELDELARSAQLSGLEGVSQAIGLLSAPA